MYGIVFAGRDFSTVDDGDVLVSAVVFDFSLPQKASQPWEEKPSAMWFGKEEEEKKTPPERLLSNCRKSQILRFSRSFVFNSVSVVAQCRILHEEK